MEKFILYIMMNTPNVDVYANCKQIEGEFNNSSHFLELKSLEFHIDHNKQISYL